MRNFRARIAGLLTVLLTIGLGAGSIVPAYAADDEFFGYSITALDTSSGQSLSQVETGKQFHYVISTNCIENAGCGAVEMKFAVPAEGKFLQDAFTVPVGAVQKSFTPGAGGKGGELVIAWPNLTERPAVYIPVMFDASLDASLNGSKQLAEVQVQREGEEVTQKSISLDLNVWSKPGINAGATLIWQNTASGEKINSVTEVAGNAATLVMSAIAEANSESKFTFQYPSATSGSKAAVTVAEAFDLKKLKLSSNPSGATVTYKLQGGSTTERTLAAGVLESDAPADVVGYTVVVGNFPSLSTSSAAERTASISADYVLRSETRTTGARIVEEGKANVSLAETADVINSVDHFNPASGGTAKIERAATISVNALQPEVAVGATWVTHDGDNNTSVYGSGETSTATVLVANTGEQQLLDLTVKIPMAGAGYFDYTDLTALPRVTFPAGSTKATIQYQYGDGTTGAAHPFTKGGAVPGPGEDTNASSGNPRGLGEVKGIVVVFAPATVSIPGNCVGIDETSCAGKIELDGKLREVNRSTGKPIEPPAEGETRIKFGADIAAQATTKVVRNLKTPDNVDVVLVNPKFKVELGKRLGDGADDVVYPLTGQTKSGDLYDRDAGPGNQNYRPHQMKFVVKTEPGLSNPERVGAQEFVIMDPVKAPTVATLKDTPFNLMEFTKIDAAEMVCTTPDGSGGQAPYNSSTTQTVWLAEFDSPTSRIVTAINEVPLADIDSPGELERVVGLKIVVSPAAGDKRFPVDVKCVSGDDTSVKFRQYALEQKKNTSPTGEVTYEQIPISPDTVGNPSTPGLFSPANTAEVTTGTNAPQTTGTDSLFLVDISLAVMYKHFARDAKRYGVQEQDTQTSFVLSSIPQGEDVVSVRMTDGSVSKSGLDVFDVTAIHTVHVGPDQEMKVSLFAADGSQLAPVGTVESSIELDGEELDPADIENSQSAKYREFWDKVREPEWSVPLDDTVLGQIAKIQVDVTRGTADAFMQKNGAASITADMQLRDTFRSLPAETVVGSMVGVDYYNTGVTESFPKQGATQTKTSEVKFRVYAGTDVYGFSEAGWFDAKGSQTPLVAKNFTPSKIVLDVSNRTAVGTDAPPKDQWKTPGHIPIGVDQVSVSVNGDAASGKNPFAVVDFNGVSQMWWPVKDGATVLSQMQEDRVNAKILYSYADGTSETIVAPYVKDEVDQLNPPKNRWPDVVGITVTWSEAGKYVGIEREGENRNRARLAFNTVLRDNVRGDLNTVTGACTNGYTYNFVDAADASIADTLTGCKPIDNPAPLEPNVAVDNHAVVETPGLGKAELDARSNLLALVGQDESMNVTLKASTPQRLYRDLPKQQVAVTYTGVNTSNTPVSSMWLTTDCRLLAESGDCQSENPNRDLWPRNTPAGYGVVPGLSWDAFNVLSASVSLPVGAVKATVWALDESGEWTEGIEILSGTPAINGSIPIVLPTSGPGPNKWDEIIAFRVQFDGDEATRKRIAVTAGDTGGKLNMLAELRQTLRSDPDTRAPADEITDDGVTWLLGSDAAGTLHIGDKPTATEKPFADAASNLLVYAGNPVGSTKKFTSLPSTGSESSSKKVEPGEKVDFHIRVTNDSKATSNMYDLAVADQFPEELVYIEGVPEYRPQIISVPDRAAGEPPFETPTFTVQAGNKPGLQQARATWTHGEYLKPGESILLKVPLMVKDGFKPNDIATNQAWIEGNGVTGAGNQGRCFVGAKPEPELLCSSNATVTGVRIDKTRVESYIDASAAGAINDQGEACVVSPAPGSGAVACDNTWLTYPWQVNTTVGNTDTYRVKLVNSGNIPLAEMRFVNGLPFIGDQGVLNPKQRNSDWAPSFIPGSIKLIGAETLNSDEESRNDASFKADSLRYTGSNKPCTFGADGLAGQATLDCAQGTWVTDPSDVSGAMKAFGAILEFPAGKPIAGGEYVIVEYQVRVPETSQNNKVAFSTASVTGRQDARGDWISPNESYPSALRTIDTAMTLTKKLTQNEIANWHLNSDGYTVDLACTTPDGTKMDPIAVQLPAVTSIDGEVSTVVTGLPVDGTCAVVDETYVPTADTAAGQYGKKSVGASGFNFSTDPEDPITLLPYEADGKIEDVPAENKIAVENTYVESSLTVGVKIAGNATDVIRPDDKFLVDVTCDFGTVTKTFDTLELKAGDTAKIPGIAVGANCAVTETDARGANPVTGQYEDGTPVELDSKRTVSVATIEPGDHKVEFVNYFNAGGDLVVTKKIELPKSGTAFGDVELATSCTLAGHELNIGDKATQNLTFGAGETEKSFTVSGVPAGAECTVSETAAGGANVPAPDRTVTILSDKTVYVEMTNIFTPATLSLTKELAGAGAKESRVPSKFDVQATCTRDLTIGGKDVTVTDHDAKIALTPGAPINVAKLPAGSQCEITEPYRYQAESTKFESLTAGVENLSKDDTNSAVVMLAEANANGDAVTTAVRVTNSYKKTEGLVITGGAVAPFGAAALLLLAGLGIVLFRKRRTGEAS
ncbi:hypothetical protein ICL81_03585 [Leucobacter sp. cx-328]|uniref:DUF5979 domain-containing protein n=1 Tax=unclassified Leucobacter TaxID=2621730 RepID=UPI0019A683A6|nr:MULTISPECIES: DUF5979 domain-containing protein [unclassified Leucobacter]MBC9943608.1 hypothetical protein [Leucobacter sp. cx-328]